MARLNAGLAWANATKRPWRSNIDLFVILDAAERSLDQLDARADVKAEARTALQRMKAAGASVATATVTEVLAAAVRKAIGLQ